MSHFPSGMLETAFCCGIFQNKTDCCIMISTAVVSILLLAFFSENCAGLNAVQVHINDTKRSPMIGQQQQQQKKPFGRDYIDFPLSLYLYGTVSTVPVNFDQFFQDQPVKDEIGRISQEIANHMHEKQVQVQPPMTDVFKAFRTVNLDNMRVVILGQDPTPIPGEATGLAFSLNPDLKLEYPTSTGNILKLLQKHGYKVNLKNGDLTKWANEGVLLLNSALTITVTFKKGDQSEADWHQELWRQFTQKLIKHISDKATHRLIHNRRATSDETLKGQIMRATLTLLLLIACLLAYVASKKQSKDHAPNQHQHGSHGTEHKEGKKDASVGYPSPYPSPYPYPYPSPYPYPYPYPYPSPYHD
ncbi:hypothetical protein ACROYT_G011409 [Oculina patagonica]